MSWLTERSRNGGIDEVPFPDAGGRVWLAGKHFVAPDADAALARVGADVLVCLNEARELADRYPSYLRWLADNASGRAIWHPIPDLHAPSRESAIVLMNELARLRAAGAGLLIHCGAGIGRAGTIAAALLIGCGVSLDGALATVSSARPMAGPEAGAQLALLQSLASAARPS